MKTFKNIFFIALALSVMGIVSCSKDKDPEPSKVTFLPQISLIGDKVVVVNVGDEFEDQGALALIQGKEVEYETKSNILPGQPGIYTVTYFAKNEDGFSSSIDRTVMVIPPSGDLETSIEGVYTSTVLRGGVEDNAYKDMEYIFIWQTEDGNYAINDASGGYYSIGRGYGSDYAAQGVVITANDIPSNDFSISGGFLPAFGLTPVLSSFTAIIGPDGEKTISFICTLLEGGVEIDNGTFNVILKQINL